MWSTLWQIVDSITTGGLPWLGLIFSLAMFGELGLPATSPILEGLLMLTGFQIAHGGRATASIPFLIVASTGRLCGSTSTYWLAASLGSKMLDRFGKYIRVTQRRLDQITQKIGTSAIPIIIVARFTPGFTVASSIACGLSKIPYKEFLAAVSTHTLAWEMIFLAMGILGGRVSEYLNLESRHTLLAVWIAVVITVAAGAGYLVFRRARNSA